MAGISSEFTLGGWISIAVLVGLCFTAIYIWLVERSKVAQMPRVPMKLCDKHGSYPASESLWIDALQDGRQDLAVEICPFCYAERLKEAAANARK